MAVLFSKSRNRTVLIVIASILIVGVSAAGAIVLLKNFGPHKQASTSAESTEKTSVSPLKKAENLFAEGDYAGAKAQYQTILETYKAENNQAGVADIEMQLKVIDATAQAQQTPQNTDKNRVTVGPTQKK
jgi:hypothetical protein